LTKEEQRRFDVLVDNLRTRLRPVCENWPEPLFEEMIRQLADITVKYEVDEGIRVYDRRGTDRLVADMKELLDRNQRHRGDSPPEERA
jgi:hypothetical protein